MPVPCKDTSFPSCRGGEVFHPEYINASHCRGAILDMVADMDNLIQEKKFFVNKQGLATIVCPACGKSKVFDTNKLPPGKSSLRVKCKCGEEFKARFEFRKQYRKDVSLDGRYENRSRNGDAGDVVIDDISMGGVGFHTLEAHEIDQGHVLTLHFTLDTNPPRDISRQMRVMRVSGRNIGCSYVQPLDRDPDIGFYLMA